MHPRGKGPVAWVQYFEYALAHWLQKSAEHVLGSVLCMPGAFSMYRATALEEVMYIYAKTPATATEFLQYDQVQSFTLVKCDVRGLTCFFFLG